MRNALRLVYALAMMFAIAGATVVTALPLASAQTDAAATGSMRITFRGCPDGVDPTIDTTDCTIPLDAPDASTLIWEASSLNIAADVEREPDGTYVVPNLPADTYMMFEGFEPLEHNHFTFTGVDKDFPSGNDKWHPDFVLAAGEVREVAVYYWNGPDGPNPGAETSLELTFRSCPDGVDPSASADPVAECVIPLDAPPASIVQIDGEDIAIADSPRLDDGTYQFAGLPAFSAPLIFDLFPSEHDAYYVTEPAEVAGPTGYRVYLDRGETARAYAFYYNERSGNTAPASGAIDITLRGCPDGVDPTQLDDPGAECTIPLDAPESAGVIWGGDGQGGAEVFLAPRFDDGTYHLESVPAETTVSLSGFEPSERDSFLVVGDVESVVNGDAELYVETGVSYQVFVYYFNAP